MALAERAMAIDAGANQAPPHAARFFAKAPGPGHAADLLEELATAPCRFAPPATDRPLALYGAGNLGRLALDFVRAVSRDVVMVVDRNAGEMAGDPGWSNVTLLHPDTVPEQDKAELLFAVSVATAPYVPLERALRAAGFRHVAPFYDWAENFRDRHPLSNGWFAPLLSATNKTATAAVLARWDDDVSRAHHLQFLAWRRLREEWTFAGAPVPDCTRFFIPEVMQALDGCGTLLDGGAHRGLVSEEFIVRTDGRFERIVAIEPDPASRAVLQGKLGSDPRIAVMACALGERDGEAMFHHGLDYASQLSPTGSLNVPVRAIDSLGLSPDFIKLHLEGYELAALKGARETLSRCRPIVAATVYHNADGICKTAAWLMDVLPRHRFLFRAHSWCGTGAVVYAIPRESTA